MGHIRLTSFHDSILTSIVALSKQLPLPLEHYTAGRARLTKAHADVLKAIADLANFLPLPLEEYTAAMGRIRCQKFGVPGRGRGEVTKGYIDGHQIRVTEPFGRTVR